ncbi:MAG: 3-isopropylmalate dehydratase large subunit [Gemmatimonadetes bacterium]|nr:3-isopropylmalate dehydratase large subunit [Gemmatimonadota bacterium]
MSGTLFDRIWNSHVVRAEGDAPAVLGVDLHLVHEVTSPQAFTELRSRGLRVRRPDRTIATMDHATPTMRAADGGLPVAADAAAQTATLEENCLEFAVPLYALGHERQGIVHVIGPELGLTQPGMTIVCGDSHTSTHGAFGALAFGIGTSEVAHVLATQCLLQRRARTMEVRVDGTLGAGVTAKDVALAIIAKVGVGGGAGHVIEYTGAVIRALPMEGRMTVCNMSIEAGARAGMIAPDDTTISWLAGRPFSPSGAAWDAAVGRWRAFRRDDDERFDRTVSLDMSGVAPMITWGTNPGMSIPIDGTLPVPNGGPDAAGINRALSYMNFEPGSRLLGHRVDVVFIGSCTNSRISDLRDAAAIFRGRTVAPNVRVLVVPGSQSVKREAEREGLAEVFRAAGAEWRESGCSMCIAMNADRAGPGEYVVSTSNRNFEGRQGKGARTLLASPVTAAACAVRGEIADPRSLA